MFDDTLFRTALETCNLLLIAREHLDLEKYFCLHFLKNKVLTMVLVKLQETSNAVYVSFYISKTGKLSAYFPNTPLHYKPNGMQPWLWLDSMLECY